MRDRPFPGLVATLGCHRKHAIRLLRRQSPIRPKVRLVKARKYTIDAVLALEKVWRITNCIAAKRLVPALKELVEALERHGELILELKTRELLLGISAATADRLLRRVRQADLRYHGKATTKPGTLLKHSIPIRTFADWDDAKPGFVEIHLVAHCDESTRGEYLHSFNAIDVATRWTEPVAIVNRSQFRVSRPWWL